MRGLLLIGLGVIATLYVASQARISQPWATDVCDRAGNVCDNSQWLLIASAVVILAFALASMMRN
jgi:hypothetical protein